MSSIISITELEKSLETVMKFKGENLYDTVATLEQQSKGKKRNQIIKLNGEYKAALMVKQISTQIDEVIHATGILSCLPSILEDDEHVVSLSLASAARGDGIDLVTNKRIAEFKFSHSIEGFAKRNAFSDFVSLYLRGLELPGLRKELYVFNADRVRKVFNSKKSDWRKLLSKHGTVKDNLAKALEKHEPMANSLYDVLCIADVTIISIETILN